MWISVPLKYVTSAVAPVMGKMAALMADWTSVAVASKAIAAVVYVVLLCVIASVKEPSVVGFVRVTTWDSPSGALPLVTSRGVTVAYCRALPLAVIKGTSVSASEPAKATTNRGATVAEVLSHETLTLLLPMLVRARSADWMSAA